MNKLTGNRHVDAVKNAMNQNRHSCQSAEWIVYILECADTSLYTGITNNLDKRLKAHARGCASKYTRSRRPVTLMAKSHPLSKSDALRPEMKIKKVARSRKLTVLNQHRAES